MVLWHSGYGVYLTFLAGGDIHIRGPCVVTRSTPALISWAAILRQYLGSAGDLRTIFGDAERGHPGEVPAFFALDHLYVSVNRSYPQPPM